MTLPIVVGYFKMNTAKSINLFGHTPGQPVWQRNFYEHIIRDERDMQMINEYIIANPATRSTDLEIHKSPWLNRTYNHFILIWRCGNV